MGQREERLEKQMLYQREYRARRKRERVPDRDDLARAMLHHLIVNAQRRGLDRKLDELAEAVSKQLVERGFSADATEAAWEDLFVRYSEGWDFFPKPHLRQHEIKDADDDRG